ncbi:hypothetical protein GCM10027610_058770 [Dactylosporangium cerinum]
MGVAGWLQAAFALAVVVALHVPLGNHLARVYTAEQHWRVERWLYRWCGVDLEDARYGEET